MDNEYLLNFLKEKNVPIIQKKRHTYLAYYGLEQQDTYVLKEGVLCLLRTIFLETTYASCSGSTPASISNFVFLRIFGAFKASPSLSPTLPMKR